MGLREFRALDADQLSRELVDLGSRNAVARKFGVAPTTVADKMKKLGVSFCQNPNIERFHELSRDEVLESLKTLGSRAAVAERFGVSIPSVNIKMDHLGIEFSGYKNQKTRPYRISEAVRDLTPSRLLSLLNEHGGSYGLAKHLGVSQSVVQRAKSRLGVEFHNRLSKEEFRNQKAFRDLTKDELYEELKNSKDRNDLANKFGVSTACITNARVRLGIKYNYLTERKKPVVKTKRKPPSIKSCEICGTGFKPERKRSRFCSRKCSGVHMSRLYSDGRLCGENNPNFGNGEKLKKAWERGDYDARPVPKSVVSKGGRFNGTYYRSSWEIAFAEDLFAQGVDGYYEKKRFVLNDGKHYTPDFRLGDTFIEIKGFWYEKSLKKFKAFQEENPTVDVVILGEEWWKTRPSLSEKERCDLNVLRTFHSPV